MPYETALILCKTKIYSLMSNEKSVLVLFCLTNLVQTNYAIQFVMTILFKIISLQLCADDSDLCDYKTIIAVT